MDLFDFVENEAKINATFHLANADALARESNTFLNLLLAGAGGSLAYMINLAGKGAPVWQQVGIGTSVAWLFAIAAMIIWKCLWTRPIYPPANEPQNLLQEGFDLEKIRRVEMRNRQQCIDANRERNDSIGAWLNRCRALASATPIVIAFAALLAY